MTSLPIAGVGLTVADIEARAAEIYVCGYPLVLMDVTRRVATAIAAPGASKAPINQFLHARTFPDRAAGAIAPELDTLASTAWLDLSKEPIVLSVPCLGRRYYVMQLCDAWTNVFASPGSRTTGTAERDFVIVGPHAARGTLPRCVTAIHAPTNMVWLLGRTHAKGTSEHPCPRHSGALRVDAAGRDRRQRPAACRRGARGGGGRHTPPPLQVERMPPLAFFRRLAMLMTQNPPADVDNMALARFAPLGIIGRTPREGAFETKALPPLVAQALEEGARIGHARIAGAAETSRDPAIRN